MRCSFIGTNVTGTATAGNVAHGVLINSNASGNIIGGTVADAGNLISGNSSDGVHLVDLGTTSNLVQGNFIGIDITGSFELDNLESGVFIGGGASNNSIGGTASRAGNLISSNRIGITLSDSSTTGNVIQGNLIGPDISGTRGLGNREGGVLIDGASSNEIGGTGAGAGNIISRNGVSGITIIGANATGNKIRGNRIGTDITGTVALGNAGDGVVINDASLNEIGGTAARAGNIISGHSESGVDISGRDATGNKVLGNRIGTDVTGTAALGNSYGVRIAHGSWNEIGGTTAGAGNTISGNLFGVEICCVGATGNKVIGNRIGTDINGTATLGNSMNGVNIMGTSLPNEIGGVAAGARNTIAFNGANGIVLSFSAMGNAILSNSIFENGNLGIDLGDDGVTPNDPGDGDGNQNNLQNFPEYTNAEIDGAGDLLVTYLIDTDPINATYPLTVEFFEADVDTSEGQVLLGRDTYTKNDHDGCFSPPCEKTVNVGNAATLSILSGDFAVATATDDDGNTSEFTAPAVQVSGGPSFTITLKKLIRTATGTKKVKIKWDPADVNKGKIDFYVDEAPDGTYLKRTRNDGVYKLKLPTAQFPGDGPFAIQACEKNSTTVCSNVLTANFTGVPIDFNEPEDDPDDDDAFAKRAVEALPETFALHGNYPNPFNPTTTLTMDVPEAGVVHLAVYDLLGREVRVLVEGKVAAGRHEVTFEAGGLPSGTYVVRLVTPQGSFTRKMLLLK